MIGAYRRKFYEGEKGNKFRVIFRLMKEYIAISALKALIYEHSE